MSYMNEFKLLSCSILLLYYNSIYKFKKIYILNKRHKLLDTSRLVSNYLYYFHNNINILFGKVNITVNINNTINILISLLKNHKHIKKLFNYFNNISNKCSKSLQKNKKQNGGFFYNKFDSVFTKILNVVDIIFDVITIIPNHVLTTSLHHIAGPYQFISSFTNLARGNYLLAFFSFIGIIPGIGPVVGSSLKLIHHIVTYILDKIYVAKENIYLEDIESMRYVYKLDEFDPLKKYTPYESLDSIENEELLL